MRNLFRRATVHRTESLTGAVRVDTRTKRLTQRLRSGDIAIIDHQDIDQVAAETLVSCAPSAVLNAARSCSGRYPNMGPQIIVDAGIPLIDDLGPDIMDLSDGQQVTVEDGAIRHGEEIVAKGTVQTADLVEENLIAARAGLAEQMEAFAANTMDFLRREQNLLLDGVGVPDISVPIAGRQALIVVRGYSYKEDLAALRHYVREYRPVLIGVDGGADALLDAGWKPDLIVGDMDSVSDRALTCGAEVVVHAYRDGYAPGLQHVERLGVPHVVFPAAGTSEDIAMLLADDKGASLIVAVGTHATLVEFLDKGRAGMASTFLTRLRVGSKLVDAKGVSRLYRQRIATWQLVVLIGAGLFALWAALAATDGGQTVLGLLGARMDDVFSWISGFFNGF